MSARTPALSYEGFPGLIPKLLLLWAKPRAPVLCSLPSSLTREICDYMTIHCQVLSLFLEHVYLYHIDKDYYESAPLPFNFPVSAVFCRLSARSVIVLGFCSPEVMELRVVDQHAICLSDMTEARGYPGIIPFQGAVYVFGGSRLAGALKSAEKYHISEGRWRQLADSQYPKCGFTPVEHKSAIYLICFFIHQNHIEVFDTVSEQYTAYAKLPEFSEFSFSAFVGAEILIVTSSYEYRLSLEPDIRLSKKGSVVNSYQETYSRSPPVVRDGNLWVAFYWTAGIGKYAVNTRKLSQVKSYEDSRVDGRR